MAVALALLYRVVRAADVANGWRTEAEVAKFSFVIPIESVGVLKQARDKQYQCARSE